MTLRTAVSDRSGRPVDHDQDPAHPREPHLGVREGGRVRRAAAAGHRAARSSGSRATGFAVTSLVQPVLFLFVLGTGLSSLASRGMPPALSSGPSSTRAYYRCPCCSRPFFPRHLLCLPGNRHSAPGRPGGRSLQPDSDPDRNRRTPAVLHADRVWRNDGGQDNRRAVPVGVSPGIVAVMGAALLGMAIAEFQRTE